MILSLRKLSQNLEAEAQRTQSLSYFLGVLGGSAVEKVTFVVQAAIRVN